jgi:hypothetical protein
MVKPLTQKLYDAIMMDEWPSGMATLVDFGLVGDGAQDRYEALYYPIRAGEITLEQLDAALGDGPKLTTLVSGVKSNPHKGIVFTTPWDNAVMDQHVPE